jgi:hypothetical protein
MATDNHREESLIKEYQATQDMIRHYDDISMRFGAASSVGIYILIGLAFGLLSKDKLIFTYLFPFVIVFVAMSHLITHMMFKRHRSIAQIKISRILEIEKELHWQQFSLVDKAIKAGKIESAPVRKMLSVYQWGLPLVLLCAYFVIIFFMK